jgi:predicted peptidase
VKRRYWYGAAIAIPALIAGMGTAGAAVAAPPAHKIQLIGATLITEVTPVGNMVTGVALEYDRLVRLGNSDIDEAAFVVEATLTRPDTGEVASGNRTVVEAYSSRDPEFADDQKAGNYIILELDAADPLAGTTYNDGRTQFYDLTGSYEIAQVADVVTRSQTIPAQGALANSGTQNLIVDGYATGEYWSVSGKKLPYRFFTPDRRGTRQAPLVVTLHGYGESGTNNFSQIAGNQLSTAFADPARQADNPAYVLSPQANPGGASSGAWWDEPMQTAVIELVEKTIAENPGIDPSRVYLTGMSMGSYGSWAVLAQRSDIFAGALLICGNGGADAVDTLVSEVGDLPIWAVHSIDDAVVSYSAPGSDFRIYEALQAAGTPVTWTAWDADVTEAEHEAAAAQAVAQADASGSDHIFTTFNAGTTLWGAHGSWVPVYNNDEMLDWLFAQDQD